MLYLCLERKSRNEVLIYTQYRENLTKHVNSVGDVSNIRSERTGFDCVKEFGTHRQNKCVLLCGNDHPHCIKYGEGRLFPSWSG